jgi:Zn-dependent protease with chaperone function
MEGKPAPLLLPFIWFEVSFQAVMGTQVGTTVARIVLTLIFLPVVLWLLLWLQSLCYKCALSLYYLFSRKNNRGEEQKTARELSSTLRVPAPIISIENIKAPFPVTTVLFPKHCVIHISPALIDALKQKPNDLRLMLVHELGHVVKHSTRVWWAQILSFLSLNGVGFLTLLFNYWRIETEADEYAVQVTKDRRGLISLLERENIIKGEVMGQINTAKEEKQRASKFHRFWENNLVGQVTNAYNLYFATNLWGGSHPDTQERIDNLRIYNRLSMEAKVVIECAKEEVKNEEIKGVRFRSIWPHHLLLGLLHELNLPNLPIDRVRSAIADAFADAVEDIPRYIGRSPAASQIDFHPETRQVLAHATDIADALSHHAIDPEHLWLGLLGEQDTMAVAVLESLDVDLEEMSTAVHDKLAQREAKAQDELKLSLPSQAREENSNTLTTQEELTKQAESVITSAMDEARLLQHKYVGTEHLLLGLLCESEGVAAEVLSSLGVKLVEVRDAVEFVTGRGTRLVEGEIDLTPRSRKVMKLAGDEASRLNHSVVGTEHILLGLVREGEGIAAGVLESMVGNLERVREATLAARGLAQQEAPQPQAAQDTEDTLTDVSRPPEEKHISHILATVLLVTIAAIILVPLGYNAYVSKITPTPKAPPSIRAVPTLPPDQGGGLDLNSPLMQHSIAELQKLYPYLPYYKDITLSTGVSVTINMPKKELQMSAWTLDAEIYGINYETSPSQPDYTQMKKSFLEASDIVFAWVKQHGADPYKIFYTWGDRAYIQEQAEQWLSKAS